MLSHPTDPRWLVLLLGEGLGGAWLDSDPGPAFLSGTRIFRSLADDAEPAAQSFPAFFDRLHDERGRLVGVQVTPVVWWDLPLMVGHLNYAQAVDREQRLRVFFEESPPDKVIDMGDQAFGGGIYRSDDGAFAITLDTHFLEPRDVDALQRARLNWGTARATAPGPL